MTDETARREATFLFLRCADHRGRRRRPGLKTAYRPGEGCEACRIVRAARVAEPDADETLDELPPAPGRTRLDPPV